MALLWGTQTGVNSVVVSAQNGPVTAGLGDGRSVVVWRDSGTGPAVVKYRLFDAGGYFQTIELTANQNFSGNIGVAGGRAEISVAALSDGGFVVVWNFRSGPDDDIHYRLFNPDGTPQTAELIAAGTVNTEFKPVVVGLPTGGFEIAWENVNYDQTPSNPSDSNITAIVGVEYDSNGAAVTGNTLLSDPRGGDGAPSIAYSSTFGLNLVWEDSFGQSASFPNGGIWGSEGGNPYRSDADLNGASGIFDTDPEIAYSGLNYMVVWSNYTGTSGQYNVSASVNGAGGSSFQVNTTPLAGYFSMTPQVVGLNDGTFLVLWSDGGSSGANIGGSDIDVVGRIVNGSGGFITNEFVITDPGTINNSLNSLDATLLLDGRVMVTWEAGGPTTSGTADIFIRIIDPRTSAQNWLGTSNNEQFAGTSFIDNLNGGLGNDIIAGGAAGDVLNGGGGVADLLANDWDQTAGGINGVYVDLTGGIVLDAFGSIDSISGFENVMGTSNLYLGQAYWSDLIFGSSQNNAVSSLEGRDYVQAGAGNDTLDLSSGDDYGFGEAGTDTLYGGTGTDYLDGGTEADTLYGGSEFDYLIGGAGADIIYGGTGNDYIYGDLVSAGQGADAFHLEADIAAGNIDYILDFNSGGVSDTLYLSAALQASTSFGNSAGYGYAAVTLGGGNVYYVLTYLSAAQLQAQTVFI